MVDFNKLLKEHRMKSNSFTYVSKPVEIEAISSNVLDDFASGKNTLQVPGWLMTALITGVLEYDPVAALMTCAGKQGKVQVNKDDWLIKLQDGEIYPCADAVFKNKYEKQVEVRGE